MSIPYLPLYVADYEADTAHLSIEEDGAYTRLLRLCWRTPGCSVPDDADWIMRRLRVTRSEYDRVVEPIIAEFFQRAKGRVFSPRLQREKDRIESVSQKRSEAGKKGGRPAKSLNNNNSYESRAKANGKHLEPEPEPEPEGKKEPYGSQHFAPPIDETAQAVSAYNTAAARVGWPSVQKLSPARRSALKGRLSDCGGVTGWEVALSKAEASDFLRGSTGWLPNFDWITKQANFTKLMEGNYDNRSANNSTGSANSGSRRGPHHSLMAGFAAVANRE